MYLSANIYPMTLSYLIVLSMLVDTYLQYHQHQFYPIQAVQSHKHYKNWKMAFAIVNSLYQILIIQDVDDELLVVYLNQLHIIH